MTTVPLDALVALDPSVAAQGADIAPLQSDIVRFSAADLSEAQNKYARLKADHPDSRVFVDLDVHIASDARTARRDVLASETKPRDGVLQYVGTASGLAGLIADIVAVDVADGVILRPIVDRSADDVVRSIDADVVPALAIRRVRAS
ncbi:hypothetical protein ASG56_07920 [Rhodococcus sp. Leaf7]|uniref:hypothetical protein n=1 Tax=unclassified Rhodococcus (in: high G+C Gram-positive bacteria) TaxID=192944 RepID=UPI0006F929A9|nr:MULTISPECIES: hypothetical protein [unclassified Rhodococcus (in: high G+C Gram-positive bacteria)]KQU07423.1 hypothetical protein ASG56_07920 [Rhodococcus sp. Leaf7]KQU42943.1 hypothetical protein ASG64_07920 [Rhodococcus sp. Leaf247]